MRLDELCPTKMALAIHRHLLPLMESDPTRFPTMTMCFRTHRLSKHVRLCYGKDSHTLDMDQAREYLTRLIEGFTGRHTEPETSES